MPDMVVIDTDILIDTGRGVEEAINCLNLLAHQRSVAISTITQMDLIVGCRNKDELLLLGDFI